MEWELQDSDGREEFWTCCEKEIEKEIGDIYTFMADVFIDRSKESCSVEFDVYSLPRHVVEDMGWKNLREAISGLKKFVIEMERVDKAARLHDIKIFSDNFVGFRTELKLNTSNKDDIKKEIIRVRKLLKI